MFARLIFIKKNIPETTPNLHQFIDSPKHRFGHAKDVTIHRSFASNPTGAAGEQKFAHGIGTAHGIRFQKNFRELFQFREPKTCSVCKEFCGSKS
jgi:hypothetical protein